MFSRLFGKEQEGDFDTKSVKSSTDHDKNSKANFKTQQSIGGEEDLEEKGKFYVN